MLAPPTEEQLLLFEAVTGVYLEHGQWPGWPWVDETFERLGLDAAAILAGCPHEPSVGYGYITPRWARAPLPQDRIKLTIAGLVHIDRAKPIVDGFLSLIDALGAIRGDVHLDPFSETRPTVTRETVETTRGSLVGEVEALVVQLLGREPATWHCTVDTGSDGVWTSIQLAPAIRRFAGVSSPNDYLDRLAAWLVPTVAMPSERSYHSPFSLPAAVDYLDVVWQLRFGKRLVSPPGVERSARLAFDASTAEEADSHLSALAELLKNLHVPGVPGSGGGYPPLPPGSVLGHRASVRVPCARRRRRRGSQRGSTTPCGGAARERSR